MALPRLKKPSYQAMQVPNIARTTARVKNCGLVSRKYSFNFIFSSDMGTYDYSIKKRLREPILA